ncbi:hypothetical protein HMPREF1214_02032 [Bacteroides sp. HPS0048]|uniref:hypothetical protein n=1 Tax=Bacteroides sp. HPS0048 TaxID=1078089 RepID=UPI00037E0E51|nr:hypothetical protein [Bacteroides sp. HPS0048]EOA58460.1 hypothetical protein HMPREF1214_02032 [Bacteroides sp. HPS0048]
MSEFDDIINLPHPVSKTHPQMSMYNRATQFAPFAALTGHDEAIAKTVRKNEKSFEKQGDNEDFNCNWNTK